MMDHKSFSRERTGLQTPEKYLAIEAHPVCEDHCEAMTEQRSSKIAKEARRNE